MASGITSASSSSSSSGLVPDIEDRPSSQCEYSILELNLGVVQISLDYTIKVSVITV
jgi:hypothetical protein